MDSSVQDLQVIKRDYLTSLVELKDTTKPIITNLTVIASEGIHVAPAFVAAIAERILDPKNFNKLPSLYLMDSILKNVGGVYIDLFSSLIVKLFSESFLNADDKTKKSMLKLLNTWRHPSPSSSFLPLSSSSSSASSSSTSTSSSAATTTSSRYIFPPSILTQLDSFVRSVPRPRHVILTESILNDLNTCIATKKTEHLYSTPDPQSLEQLSMLENLRTTIQSGQFPIETLELMKEKISSLSASMHLPSTSSSSSTTASISTTITSSANVNVSQIGLPLSTQTTLPPQLPTPPLPPSPSSSSSSSPLSSVASSTISATSISTATTSTSSTSSAIASFSPSTSSTSATVSPLPINSNTTSSSQVVFPSLPLFSTISSTLTASSSSTVHVPTHSVPLSSASSMMTINPPLVPLPLSSTTVPSSFSYFPLSSLASTINPTTTSLVTSPPTPPIVSPPSIPSLPTQTPPLVTSNTPTALLSLPLPSYPTTTTTTTTSTPSTSTPLTLLTPPPMLLSSGIVIPLPSTIPSFHQGLLRQKPTIQPPRPASISKDSSESSCHEPPVFEIEIHQIHPSALELLFPSNSFKCNQCGRRFLHHVQEKEMELHMDWHFRMNRKAREQGSQIQSRLWFLKASEWIQNQAPLQKYPAFFESSPSSSTSSTSTSSSRTHSPSLTFNVCKAPVSTSTSGGKQPVIQCHVCKDTLDIVFDEQEDDWILKEAVEVKDLYYHRLCWMDWMKQTISQKAAGRKSKLTIEDDSLPTVLPNGTNHASLLQEMENATQPPSKKFRRLS